MNLERDMHALITLLDAKSDKDTLIVAHMPSIRHLYNFAERQYPLAFDLRFTPGRSQDGRRLQAALRLLVPLYPLIATPHDVAPPRVRNRRLGYMPYPLNVPTAIYEGLKEIGGGNASAGFRNVCQLASRL